MIEFVFLFAGGRPLVRAFRYAWRAREWLTVSTEVTVVYMGTHILVFLNVFSILTLALYFKVYMYARLAYASNIFMDMLWGYIIITIIKIIYSINKWVLLTIIIIYWSFE